MVTVLGRVVARKGTKQRFPELMEKKFFLTDPEKIGPVLRSSLEKLQKIFTGKLS